MKKIIIIIGDQFELSESKKITESLCKKVESGHYSFECDVYVTSISINDNHQIAIKLIINHMSRDLGFIINVHFLNEFVSTKILETVKSCDRFFFIEKAKITSSSLAEFQSKETQCIEDQIEKSKSVRLIKELMYIDFRKDTLVQRGLYFDIKEDVYKKELLLVKECQLKFHIIGDKINFEKIISGIMDVN